MWTERITGLRERARVTARAALCQLAHATTVQVAPSQLANASRCRRIEDLRGALAANIAQIDLEHRAGAHLAVGLDVHHARGAANLSSQPATLISWL